MYYLSFPYNTLKQPELLLASFVNKDGLCKSCTPVVSIAVQNELRIIEESINLVDTSKKYATRISRCDDIISAASRLLEYEGKGIPVSITSSSLIQKYETIKKVLIDENAQQEVGNIASKAAVAKNTTSKINNLNKAILKIKEYEALMLNLNAVAKVGPIPWNEEARLLNAQIDKANQLFFELSQQGTKLEQDDKNNEAITLYEKITNYSTDIPHPYSRLAILYRKQKRYTDEVRILEKAVYVYETVVYHERGDRLPKLNKFKERLKKAQSLLEKSNEGISK